MFLEKIIRYKINNIDLIIGNKYKVKTNCRTVEGILNSIDEYWSVIILNDIKISINFIENIEEIL